MKIHWSPRAVEGYLSVLRYLQTEWGDQAVESFVNRVDVILGRIAANPRMFIASQQHKNVRRCIVTRHTSLYYRQNMDVIELVAFIDNRSDPRKKDI